MNSLLLKLASSMPIKDTVAVLRGMYRVSEGFFNQGSANSIRKVSWTDHIP